MNNRIIQRPGATIAILLGTFFFFLCIFSLISSLIMPHIDDAVTAVRLLTFFQALFLFIVPALITAVLSTRLPATFLAIEHRPRLVPTLLIIATLVAAIPAMNMIIEWNAAMHLPDSMKGLEDTIRQMEEAAAQATETIMGSDSIGSLIVTILIVGVMAGLSEELFFRGALQRTFSSTRMNRHIAVWLAATIFSTIHFQFFGFVPRLLLGAFFGYILLWGDNLWYCVIAHAANNIFATLSMWYARNDGTGIPVDLNTIGQSTDATLPQWPLVTCSLILTIIGLRLTYKQLHTNPNSIQ